jgi:anti-sigma factor RsiW
MNPLRDAWTDRLSEYVDGELDAAERAALEVHLQLCERCAATVGELRAVVARAGALEPLAPETDLWPPIEARIATAPGASAPDLGGWRAQRAGRASGSGAEPPRRWSFTLPQLAAAAVLLVMLSSATVWTVLALRPAAGPTQPGAAGPAQPGVGATGSAGAPLEPAVFEPARYDAAIADLERVLREHRSELEPATIRVIEQNLLIIDQAAAQARKALAADPASPYLNGHLAEQLRRKLTLLRQATAIVAAHG